MNVIQMGMDVAMMNGVMLGPIRVGYVGPNARKAKVAIGVRNACHIAVTITNVHQVTTVILLNIIIILLPTLVMGYIAVEAKFAEMANV